MTKGTQLWPGDRMRAFFRAHIRRQTALDGAEAERLADVLTHAVNRMLVWEMPAADAEAGLATAAGAKPAKPAAQSKPDPAKPASAAPGAAPGSATAAAAKPPSGKDSSAAGKAAGGFDPYAFSAMVVLAKTGRDGLLKRLAEIKSLEHLKAFAEAQHLAVDPALKKADDVRKALVSATEKRLADRKAAAS